MLFRRWDCLESQFKVKYSASFSMHMNRMIEIYTGIKLLKKWIEELFNKVNLYTNKVMQLTYK